MNTTLTSTNPTDVRRNVERLLAEGLPAAPLVIAALTDTAPDAGYAVACYDGNCAQQNGGPCQPSPVQPMSQVVAAHFAAAALDDWERTWLRRGSTGVLARGWVMEHRDGTKPVTEWVYGSITDATQTIGFDLNQGQHTSLRGQRFWISDSCVVVVTHSAEHGEVIHTIEPYLEGR